MGNPASFRFRGEVPHEPEAQRARASAHCQGDHQAQPAGERGDHRLPQGFRLHQAQAERGSHQTRHDAHHEGLRKNVAAFDFGLTEATRGLVAVIQRIDHGGKMNPGA